MRSSANMLAPTLRRRSLVGDDPAVILEPAVPPAVRSLAALINARCSSHSTRPGWSRSVLRAVALSRASGCWSSGVTADVADGLLDALGRLRRPGLESQGSPQSQNGKGVRGQTYRQRLLLAPPDGLHCSPRGRPVRGPRWAMVTAFAGRPAGSTASRCTSTREGVARDASPTGAAYGTVCDALRATRRGTGPSRRPPESRILHRRIRWECEEIRGAIADGVEQVLVVGDQGRRFSREDAGS